MARSRTLAICPKSRTLDPHQQAVYEWEDEWADWNRGTLSLRQCRGYVVAACALFGLDPPVVKQHRGKAMSWSLTSPNGDGTWTAAISFNLKHKNPAIVLHETAHYIHARTCKHPGQDHGPTWLGIYMALLIKAEVAPKTALYATARKHKLRWVLPKKKAED